MATRWFLENTRVYYRARDFARAEYRNVRPGEKDTVPGIPGRKSVFPSTTTSASTSEGTERGESGRGLEEQVEGELLSRPETAVTEEHEINVIAKKLWVCNVSFGFIAEAIR